jgi:hypothetical protein
MNAESFIEKWLGVKVRQLKVIYYKFVSPGNSGVPDRILVLPTGEVWFVELKDDKGILSPIQMAQQHRLIKSRAKVFTLYGMTGAMHFLEKELKPHLKEAGYEV